MEHEEFFKMVRKYAGISPRPALYESPEYVSLVRNVDFTIRMHRDEIVDKSKRGESVILLYEIDHYVPNLDEVVRLYNTDKTNFRIVTHKIPIFPGTKHRLFTHLVYLYWK